MLRSVEIPVWLLVLILLFAAVTFASHFLFPSVRWFLRRRAERIVEKLNERLARPIEPFKLARRSDMIQRLVYHPDVTAAVTEHADRTGVREDVAFERAKRYAREIVPSFSASAYFGFGTRVARYLSTRLYTVRIGHYDEAAMTGIDPGATVVYVMNHRSNMDYVLVTYLVANQSALAYAVGEWARIWPLQPLIKALGGYFIRRRERNALYRRVLARYVKLATRGGLTQAVFPEGGLSQTGAVGTPKVGLLSYLLDAYDPEGRDLVFVPVALNYDRVIEDRLLVEAHAKGEKRFRGTIPSASLFVLRYISRRLSGRAGRFGTAGVGFGTPLSLNRMDRIPGAEELAAELMTRIRAVMPVLAVPLVADVLDGADGPMPRDAMLDALRARLAELTAEGAVILADDGGAEGILDAALEQLLGRGIVKEGAEGLFISEGKEGLIRYYAAALSASAGKFSTT